MINNKTLNEHIVGRKFLIDLRNSMVLRRVKKVFDVVAKRNESKSKAKVVT